MTILSNRETRVLLLLGCYRYLSRDQIAGFVFEKDDLAPKSVNTTSWRILGSLGRRGLVKQTERQVGGPGGGSTCLGYYLTASGIRLARSLDPGLPPRRPAHGGTFLLQHALMTADVALAFRRAARGHAGHDVLDWECDWQAAAHLAASAVLPDARLIYASADHEVDALVEIDLGTEGTRFFARKILRYLDLFRSGEWQKGLPLWPVVLTVTRDDARAAALQRCTESVLQQQPDHDRLLIQTEFGFAGLGEVVNDPLGIIWRIARRSGRYALLDGRHLE